MAKIGNCSPDEAVKLWESGLTQKQVASITGWPRYRICEFTQNSGYHDKRPSLKHRTVNHNQPNGCGTYDFAAAFAENQNSENLEYIGGYVNERSRIRLKCKECGCEFERTIDFMMHGYSLKCPECKRMEVEQRREELRVLNESERTIRNSKEYAKVKTCRECGRVFHSEMPSKKYCSSECRNKFRWRNHDYRRRMRETSNGASDNISLADVRALDDDTCYLCGEKVDDSDFTYNSDGYFCCGAMYPTIDHVIPLSRGGTHTKDNVRLAHHICNSRKNDSIKFAS